MAKWLVLLGLWLYAEGWLAGQVEDRFGLALTILLLVVATLAGGKLIRQAGVATWNKATAKLQAGAAIGMDLAEGGVLLIAGGLLVLPGFLSDVVATLLLLPPVRRLAATLLIRSLRSPLKGHRAFAGSEVIDGEAIRDAGPPSSPPRQLLPPGE